MCFGIRCPSQKLLVQLLVAFILPCMGCRTPAGAWRAEAKALGASYLIQNGQRQVRIMKQGSGRRTELELAGSALKQPPRSPSLVGGLDRPALAVIAGQAANAFRPARPDQMIQCIFFRRKPARQRVKIHRLPQLHISSLQKVHVSKG